jgi:glycosyltransferase involved in cell wall biosynthesis
LQVLTNNGPRTKLCVKYYKEVDIALPEGARLIRLAFNATSLLSPLTGIGQYSRHLALGLANRADIDTDFFYGAVWSKAVRDAPLPGPASLLPLLRRYVPYSYQLRRLVQGNRWFVKQSRSCPFDLYHEPNILPFPFMGPTVITVHDLSWIRHPEAHPPERVRAMNKYFQPGLDQAALILTDSEFVKSELIDVFGIRPERIRAVMLGVEALFHPRAADQAYSVLHTHQLVYRNYILAVGTLEPRKNLSVALQAFMRLSPALRKQFPLVLVGMRGWNTSDLEKQIAPLVASGEIRLLGYLPREDLATVISGATTLVYPSIYEGFGLPPLEAMACGIPVISSNVSSIPEVVGDTGILIDPHDVNAFTEAMELMVTSPEIRRSMATNALDRSKAFTWANCVDGTVEAYKVALEMSS